MRELVTEAQLLQMYWATIEALYGYASRRRDSRTGVRPQLAVERFTTAYALSPYGAAPTTLPDADGNLWILPTGSMQSQNGQLVYDVVNARNVLFERVRIPAGRSLVGFGPGGVVYLASPSREGLYLERARLLGGVR